MLPLSSLSLSNFSPNASPSTHDPQTKTLALAKDAESFAARKRKAAAETEESAAEAQEEAMVAVVPPKEEPAMAATGGSSSAVNPNPSAGLSGVEVPIVCDYDVWSCFRDDDVMQQQSTIRAEESAKIPYVGDKSQEPQLKRLARPLYSNPRVHGARIVANVVGDSTLFNEWKEEMELMAGRIKNVRKRVFDSLSEKDKSVKDWSFIMKQTGMFSFTSLNKAQSGNMTNKWHLYMTKDSRISLAGLSLAMCDYLADAIIDSFHNVS